MNGSGWTPELVVSVATTIAMVAYTYGTVTQKLKGVCMTLTEVKDEQRELWKSMRRRSIASGLQNDKLEQNSPIKVKAEVIEATRIALSEELPLMRAHLDTLGYHPTKLELYRILEIHFGDLIARKVCMALEVHNHECLLATIAVLTDDPQIDDKELVPS